MRTWTLQLDMNDRPTPPRWIDLYGSHKTRHSAEHAKRAAIKRSGGILREYYRVVEATR